MSRRPDHEERPCPHCGLARGSASHKERKEGLVRILSGWAPKVRARILGAMVPRPKQEDDDGED